MPRHQRGQGGVHAVVSFADSHIVLERAWARHRRLPVGGYGSGDGWRIGVIIARRLAAVVLGPPVGRPRGHSGGQQGRGDGGSPVVALLQQHAARLGEGAVALFIDSRYVGVVQAHADEGSVEVVETMNLHRVIKHRRAVRPPREGWEGLGRGGGGSDAVFPLLLR